MIAQAPEAAELTPWLKHTEWNVALTQTTLTLAELTAYACIPDEVEEELQLVCAAFENIVEQAIATLQTIDADIRLWLASPKHESPKQMPFAPPQDPHTLVRYTACWKRFCCYMLRTAPATIVDDATVTGVAFTSEQLQQLFKVRRQVERMLHAPQDEQAKARLTTCLFALATTCIQQRLDQNTPFASPMMHWLAVEGINASANRLRRPQEYTRVLAGMLYVNRLLTLEFALPAQAWEGLALVRRTACVNATGRMEEVRRAWLVEGSASPMSKILRQLAYGKAIIKQEGSAPAVNWSSDGLTLWYTGRAIAIDGLRQCIQSLIAETERTLTQLTFGDATEVPLAQIEDSLTWSGMFNNAGFSFVTATANGLDVGFAHLLRRAVEDSSARLVKRSADSYDWNEGKCVSYLQLERQLLNQLLACMHLCGGQPACGSEIGCIQGYNTAYTQPSIYVLGGEVVVVTAYDKNQVRRGTVEYVIRYLPAAVGQLLVRYLVYVRPFARSLPHDRRNDDYLFATPNGPFTTRHASAALQTATKRHLGYGPAGLDFSSYCHIAIAIARQHLRAEYSAWKRIDPYESENESETEENIWDRQAAHGTRTAQLHYAVEAGFLQRIQQPQLNAFRAASVAWHTLMVRSASVDALVTTNARSATQYCRIASQAMEAPRQKRQRNRTLQSLATVDVRRQAITIEDRLQLVLERTLGAGASFKSPEQEEATAFVLQAHATSIVVLRTGGGKTLLFMGAAVLNNNRTVIVIVPYVTLIDDLIACASQHQVPCMRWVELTLQTSALVVVNADVAVTPSFLHYATQLASSGRLQQVFFDEAHVAIMDTTFQPMLRSLWLLRNITAPFTALTATLPPGLEMKLRDALLLADAAIFRRSTERSTIVYAVCDTHGQSLTDVTIATAQSCSAMWSPDDRGIIYVRSIREGESLAEELYCAFYNVQAANRSNVLRLWTERSGCWIVATGALGTGVDIANVRSVLHCGRP